jgi:hypothetical protein
MSSAAEEEKDVMEEEDEVALCPVLLSPPLALLLLLAPLLEVRLLRLLELPWLVCALLEDTRLRAALRGVTPSPLSTACFSSA